MQQIVGPLPLGRVRDGEMDAQMVRRGDEEQGKSLTLALLFFISLAVTCHPRKRDARIGIEMECWPGRFGFMDQAAVRGCSILGRASSGSRPRSALAQVLSPP